MPSGSPRKAPTSSSPTSARRSRPTASPPRRRTISPRPCALVEKTGQRVIAREVDVRDIAGLTALADDAVSELGGIDVVVANAGILSWGNAWELLGGGLERAHRHQPDRRLPHDQGDRAAHDPGEEGRLDHPDELVGRPEGPAVHPRLHRRQARRRRHHPGPGERARRVRHPRQQHPSRGRAHRDDERRRALPDDPGARPPRSGRSS